MAKLNPIFLYMLVLVPVLGISFAIHTNILQYSNLPKFGDKIILSYVINSSLASIIYIGIYTFRNKVKTQIGFIFVGGSFLKFIFFFILFYPSYKSDGEIGSSEFASFFVPYAICLLIETYFAVKMLQKMD